MIKTTTALLSLILFFSIIAGRAIAQPVVLLQIPSSASQIEAAEANGNQSAADQFRKSDQQIKHALLRDFKENYQYGPVYFFDIKDVEKIKNKKFGEAVFYNQEGKQVSLPSDVKQYFLANISFYPKEYVQIEKNGQTIEEEQADNHFGLGIILRNTDYTPVKGKLRFTPCKIAKRGSVFNKKKRYYVFWGSKPFQAKMEKFSAELKSTQ